MFKDFKFLFIQEKKNLTDYVNALQLIYGLAIGMLISAIMVMYLGITSPILPLADSFVYALFILFICIIILIGFRSYGKMADELMEIHDILSYHPEDTEFRGEREPFFECPDCEVELEILGTTITTDVYESQVRCTNCFLIYFIDHLRNDEMSRGYEEIGDE